MARQKTIRLRALPERPAGPTPQGGAAVIDVPFIDLTAPAPPRRSGAVKPRRRRQKKAGAASFVAMSALAAAIVVLAVAALFAGIAAGSPV